MGYSKSLKTLEDFYVFIAPLENGQNYIWVTEPGATGKLAYKIRECFYIASLYRAQYPRLAEVARHFVIEEIAGTNKVQARWTSAPTEALVLSGGYANVSPQHGGTTAGLGRAVASSGEQTMFTVIEAWRASQPSNTPLHFPSARLSDTELTGLYHWAKGWKPPLMLMVDEDSLTVGPVEEDIEQYSWHPPSAEIEPPELPKQVPIPPKSTW